MIPVPFPEYINVRIRGYHSRLLTRDTYEDLLSGDSLAAVTTFFLNHPEYSGDMESALSKLPEREGLERGVTNHFSRCISEVQQMAEGQMLELYNKVLHSFDMKNIRTILLGYHKNVPLTEIRDLLLPCGAFNRKVVAEMFDVGDLSGMVHILKKHSLIGTVALEAALKKSSDDESFIQLINRVDMNIYTQLLKSNDFKDENMKLICDIYRFEIDLKNIVSALKHVWKRETLDEDIGESFALGGKISLQQLYDISCSKALDEAFEIVETTAFHTAVEKGIIYYAETGFLHEMERFFEEVFIRKTQRYKRTDPFGVGVFIAYVWAKFVEMTNLRMIINGISFKTGAGQIRKGLIYV